MPPNNPGIWFSEFDSAGLKRVPHSASMAPGTSGYRICAVARQWRHMPHLGPISKDGRAPVPNCRDSPAVLGDRARVWHMAPLASHGTNPVSTSTWGHGRTVGHPLQPRLINIGEIYTLYTRIVWRPHGTAAAERPLTSTRNVVLTAEGLLSRRSAHERRSVPQRAWTGSGRKSGMNGRRTEMG